MMPFTAGHHQTKYLQNSPFENLLYELYTKFLKDKKASGKTPSWVKDLKDLIQDQIDAQLALDLKKISGELDMNPSYLSREFSKYFEELNFGDYVQKQSIEKAVNLIKNTSYT